MERDVTLETLRDELPEDEIVMGKLVIEWARKVNEFAAALVETRYPKATTPVDKWGGAMATVAVLNIVDTIVTTVPENERFHVFLSIAKDMQMYVLNGVDLTKFKVPDEVKDM